MLGYYRDDAASDRASTADGWFRTGDVGVMHPDGYVELKDRIKDVIISGGENITSVEVERALTEHPDVLEAAVVARPDEKWGEVPIAFVTVRSGSAVDTAELTDFARSRIAGFKVPRTIVFGELPKTSTGKIQKNVLREQARQIQHTRPEGGTRLQSSMVRRCSALARIASITVRLATASRGSTGTARSPRTASANAG